MNQSNSHNLIGLRLLQGSIETLFYLPILFIAAFYASTSSFTVAWLLTLPIVYALGALWIRKVKVNRRIYRLLIAILLGAGQTILLLAVLIAFNAELPGIAVLILGLLGAFISTNGMRAATKGWYVAFPNTLMFVSVILYVILTIVAHLREQLEPYFTFLTICGIVALVLLLYIINERLLTYETHSGGAIQSTTTKVFKRQNRFMLSIVAVLLLIAGLFRQLQSSIEAFFHAVMNRIMDWMNRSEEPVQEPPADTPPPEQSILPPVEANHPPQWLIWLEHLAKYIGITLLIIGIAVLLFFVGRKLYQLLNKALGRIWERASESKESAEGYTDEVESLVSQSKWSDRFHKPGKKKEARWEELRTTGDKVRYLYRWFVAGATGKGYSFKPHFTVKETASDILAWRNKPQTNADVEQLTRLYDEVRYGGQEPNEELVQSLRKRLDEQRK
jgi:cell division protein FtsL